MIQITEELLRIKYYIAEECCKLYFIPVIPLDYCIGKWVTVWAATSIFISGRSRLVHLFKWGDYGKGKLSQCRPLSRIFCYKSATFMLYNSVN